MIRRPKLLDLKQIINEELNNYLFEIFNKSIQTIYQISKNNIYDGNYFDIYRFKTSSGNSYDVDFYKIQLNLNQLSNISKYFPNTDIINSIHLGFTSSDYNRDEKPELSGTINDLYEKRTNKNEQYEVLGKVAFMIEEYIINNSEIKIFVIGKNTEISKLSAYIKMFENIFSSKFKMVEDISNEYEEGAIYFIKI